MERQRRSGPTRTLSIRVPENIYDELVESAEADARLLSPAATMIFLRGWAQFVKDRKFADKETRRARHAPATPAGQMTHAARFGRRAEDSKV